MKVAIKLLSAALVVGALLIACSDEGNLATKEPRGGNEMDEWYGTVWGIVYNEENEPQNGAYVSFQQWVNPPSGQDYWWELWKTITPGPDPTLPPGEYHYDNYRYYLENQKVRVWAGKGGKWGVAGPWTWHNGNTYHRDVYFTE